MGAGGDEAEHLQAASLEAGVAGVSSEAARAPLAIASGPHHHHGTLDEPVMDTIMRDVRSIGEKLMYVLMPMRPGDRGRRLKDWDLWGPLLLCLALGVILAVEAPNQEQASYAFADVFVTVWVGSAVVTFNALLLHGKVSFFQTVCVLGYCIFPLVIAAFFAMLLRVDWLKAITRPHLMIARGGKSAHASIQRTCTKWDQQRVGRTLGRSCLSLWVLRGLLALRWASWQNWCPRTGSSWASTRSGSSMRQSRGWCSWLEPRLVELSRADPSQDHSCPP
mmetsp:Transcript_151786/g.487036  ORF Transcript_151786/g.487036 Transcript_151786/m.487036 type:complete len:278 (-) Transcript_151786:243-1076(-)